MKITEERRNIIRVTVERETGEDWPAITMKPGKVLDPIGMHIEFGAASLELVSVQVIGFRMLKDGRRTSRLTPTYRGGAPRELVNLIGQIRKEVFPE
jgi:hypothetical protein